MDKHVVYLPLVGVLLLLPGCSRKDGIDPGVWNAYRNPVEQSDIQDPCAIEDEGVFYHYSSELSSGSGADQVVEYLPAMSSKNLTQWDAATSAFDDLSRPKFISGGKVICPDIARVGDRYLLYYSLYVNADNCGIGVAEAPFASGPFTDKGALITASGSGLKGVASPSFCTDGKQNYLVFGNFGGIYLVKLSEDGLSVTGTPVMIASATYDAPLLVYRDGSFYLIVTSGTTTGGASSTCKIRYGRSVHAEGPYLDRSMRDLLDDGGETLVEGSVKFAGPGHPCLVHLKDGSDWLLYNACDLSAVDRGRTLMLDRLEWADGWLTVRGKIGSFSAAAPTIES